MFNIEGIPITNQPSDTRSNVVSPATTGQTPSNNPTPLIENETKASQETQRTNNNEWVVINSIPIDITPLSFLQTAKRMFSELLTQAVHQIRTIQDRRELQQEEASTNKQAAEEQNAARIRAEFTEAKKNTEQIDVVEPLGTSWTEVVARGRYNSKSSQDEVAI